MDQFVADGKALLQNAALSEEQVCISPYSFAPDAVMQHSTGDGTAPVDKALWAKGCTV